MSRQVIDFAGNPAHYLRLLSLPVFAWAAWRDVQTRRVASSTWRPLLALGLLCMAVDAWYVTSHPMPPALPYLTQSVLTIAVIVPVSYAFWLFGAWGGADTKALIAITVVFPHYPAYITESAVFPLHVAPHTIFPLTVLTNSVLSVPLIVAALFAHSAIRHRSVRLLSFVGFPVSVDSLGDRHGKLLEDADGECVSGTVDLDSLKNYLDFHDSSFAALRSGHDLPRDDEDDPWHAEAFVDAQDNIYTPEADELRSALSRLVDGDENVWVMPGLPFLLLFLFGLGLSLVVGSVLVVALPFF